MNKPKSREKGQILVIFVLVLIGLLGLTALAIDGGMIFADRRYDQAAADASTLAGAGSAAQLLEKYGIAWTAFHCTAYHGQQAQQKAIASAKTIAASNQFPTLDNDISDKHGVVTACVDNEAAWDKHMDVRTQITSNISTAFAHLFFTGPIRNTVDSVVRIRPRTEVGFGYAIASLGSSCVTQVGGIDMGGNNDTNINGGGIFSNSCLRIHGSGSDTVTNGTIGYMSTYQNANDATVSPPPTQAPNSMPVIKLDPPACGTSAFVSHQGSGTINPGNYSLIKLTAPSHTLTLNPGLYCVKGNIDLTGGTVTGNGVTFYIINNGLVPSSFIKIMGGVTATLSAPSRSDTAAIAAGGIVGMLVYSDPANPGDISIQGNSASSFVGTIYAPSGPISIGGTGGINPTYNTQLIGSYVKINGTSNIDINFAGFEPASDPPRLDQLQ